MDFIAREEPRFRSVKKVRAELVVFLKDNHS